MFRLFNPPPPGTVLELGSRLAGSLSDIPAPVAVVRGATFPAFGTRNCGFLGRRMPEAVLFPMAELVAALEQLWLGVVAQDRLRELVVVVE